MTDIPETARVVAIASGKGGVGKSSVTVNLAVALARRGLTVGVLDADIWGFSVPRLLGMQGDVEARDKKMVPLERAVGTGLLRVLSMGFLADEDNAIMWRGLVLNRAVQQFLEDVHWGDLDFLLIDMPPGTGDIQMGLARMMPRTEVLVVTTPPLAAQKVAARTADMARKGYLQVTGVIENMSDFTCEHGTSYALFGSGGGDRLAADVGRPPARAGAPAPVGGGRRRRRHAGGARRRPAAGRRVRPDRRGPGGQPPGRWSRWTGAAPGCWTGSRRPWPPGTASSGRPSGPQASRAAAASSGDGGSEEAMPVLERLRRTRRPRGAGSAAGRPRSARWGGWWACR